MTIEYTCIFCRRSEEGVDLPVGWYLDADTELDPDRPSRFWCGCRPRVWPEEAPTSWVRTHYFDEAA